MAKIVSSPSKQEHAPTPPNSLYPAQVQAFNSIFENRLVIITGGPGSGKTHLANAVIEALICENPNAKVIATAPTGKAAFRIKHPKAITKTLHSLLNLRQDINSSKSTRPIICDLLIVDESSMINIKLFKLLFESVLPHTHVVLMGDPDQLPPVEAGPIFSDLCRLNSIPSVNLNIVKRTDIASLTRLAHFIREGQIEDVFSLLNDPNSKAQIKPLPATPPIVSDEKSAIITPFKKGSFGTDACNNVHRHRLKSPIMITQNDYKLSLMNGDIGLLEDGMVTFNQGERTKTYPLALLSHYTLAFAISIHKSQGSEFDHVHLILPQSDKPYTKEMVYTAVTRAKKTLTIYSSTETLTNALQHKESIGSNIALRFNKIKV